MNRYLIRSGFDNWHSYRPNDVFFDRLIAGNSGNMMFIYGIMNVLTTDKSEVIPTKYKIQFSDEEIDEINSTYDAFLIPLADAFREDFSIYLEAYAKLINRLKIPCILMSAGIKAPLECDGNISFPFDDKVKTFLNAILDHSSILGIRGEITGNYLKRLGYIEDKHFTVIGCPSLYTYGNNIQIDIDEPVETVAFGISPYEDSLTEQIINRLIKEFDNPILLYQLEEEFRYMYLGKEPKYFESISIDRKQIIKELERSEKTRFFYNVPGWLEFLRGGVQLFVGDRFHGAVSSVLANKKHIIIPIDARTKELAEFHQLTRIEREDLSTDFRLDLDGYDFKLFEKKQPINLRHYIDFLHMNNLNSVFDYPDIDLNPGKSPMERRIKESGNIFKTYNHIGAFHKLERNFSYYAGSVKNVVKSKINSAPRG